MKNLQLLKGITFSLMVIACLFLTSCEKESFDETVAKVKPTSSIAESENRNFNPCDELTDNDCPFGLGAVLEELMGSNISGTGNPNGKFENILNCYDVPISQGCDPQCDNMTVTHAYGIPFPWFFTWTLPADNPCLIGGFTAAEQQQLLNQIKIASFTNAPECGNTGVQMYPVHYDVIWQLDFSSGGLQINFGAIVDYVQPCGGVAVGL